MSLNTEQGSKLSKRDYCRALLYDPTNLTAHFILKEYDRNEIAITWDESRGKVEYQTEDIVETDAGINVTCMFQENPRNNRPQRNRKKMKIKVNERQFNDIRNFDYFKKKIYINKYEEDGVKYRWSFILTMEKYKLTDYFKLMEIKPLIDFERIRKYCREFNEEFDTFKRYHLTE